MPKLFTKIIVIFSFLLIALSANAQSPKSFIVMNEGIGEAKLGMNDLDGIKLLKLKTAKFRSIKNKRQTIYIYSFGKKTNNNYSMEIFSDDTRSIFKFVVNSTEYSTPDGISVNAGEKKLLQTYGKLLKKAKYGNAIKYITGPKKGTDFYVKGGKVVQIVIKDY